MLWNRLPAVRIPLSISCFPRLAPLELDKNQRKANFALYRSYITLTLYQVTNGGANQV